MNSLTTIPHSFVPVKFHEPRNSLRIPGITNRLRSLLFFVLCIQEGFSFLLPKQTPINIRSVPIHRYTPLPPTRLASLFNKDDQEPHIPRNTLPLKTVKDVLNKRYNRDIFTSAALDVYSNQSMLKAQHFAYTENIILSLARLKKWSLLRLMKMAISTKSQPILNLFLKQFLEIDPKTLTSLQFTNDKRVHVSDFLYSLHYDSPKDEPPYSEMLTNAISSYLNDHDTTKTIKKWVINRNRLIDAISNIETAYSANIFPILNAIITQSRLFQKSFFSYPSPKGIDQKLISTYLKSSSLPELLTHDANFTTNITKMIISFYQLYSTDPQKASPEDFLLTLYLIKNNILMQDY